MSFLQRVASYAYAFAATTNVAKFYSYIFVISFGLRILSLDTKSCAELLEEKRQSLNRYVYKHLEGSELYFNLSLQINASCFEFTLIIKNKRLLKMLNLVDQL